MPKRLIVTIVCFRISQVLAVLIGLAVFVLAGFMWRVFGEMFGDMLRAGGDAAFRGQLAQVSGVMGVATWVWAALFLVLCVACAVALEFIVRGLSNGRYWAWITGLVISGLFIVGGFQFPFVSLILGGLALWGLVDPDTVRAFSPMDRREQA